MRLQVDGQEAAGCSSGQARSLLLALTLAALELYRKTPTPDLVLFESNAQAAELFAQLEALSQVCSARTKVIVVGHANSEEAAIRMIAGTARNMGIEVVD